MVSSTVKKSILAVRATKRNVRHASSNDGWHWTDTPRSVQHEKLFDGGKGPRCHGGALISGEVSDPAHVHGEELTLSS